ncbi:uncharacterized protein Bfra_011099 [Botrytis fragariae]|uniref:2EXR domain-containing protein n=1 Tax=Botrytis fragariae TaxID=1964551 RepID=A0A8H6AKH6_9HELO|nr:uncharacterized protein Bfra_011099 [Botrytis fragariae]KAF5869291.1 hypothetical protein Bfra_011099 [Botrytis fragariae]
MYHVTLKEHRLDCSYKMSMLGCFKSLRRIKLILHPDETVNTNDLSKKEYSNWFIERRWTGKAKLEFVWEKEDDDAMDHSNNMTPKPSSGSGAKNSPPKKTQRKEPRTKEPRAKKSQAVKPQAVKPQAVKKPQGVDQGTQTTGPPELTEFTLFPKLPLEVQRNIWRSSFESRKVELRCGYVRPTPLNQPLPFNYPFEQLGRDQLVCKQLKIPPISKVPVAFVNRESRAETLRHYVRLYQDLHSPEHGTNLRYPCTIYFNPKIDTPIFYGNKPQYAFDKISLSLERLFPSYDPLAVKVMRSIRNVEIEFAGSFISNQDSYDLDGCRDALAMFENLETVLMLSTNTHPDPSFDIQAFLTQYFRRDENYPSRDRTTRVRLRFWSPPDWLLQVAASRSLPDWLLQVAASRPHDA